MQMKLLLIFRTQIIGIIVIIYLIYSQGFLIVHDTAVYNYCNNIDFFINVTAV